MEKKKEKPTPEAKALSIFLMAHKATSKTHKENAKRINKQWDLVQLGKIDKADYAAEVESLLASYGGYDKVVENTVWFYIKKTGVWSLKGDDKYCQDAQHIADTILKSRGK